MVIVDIVVVVIIDVIVVDFVEVLEEEVLEVGVVRIEVCIDYGDGWCFVCVSGDLLGEC